MVYTLINMILDSTIEPDKVMEFSYTEGKDIGRYFGAINHNLSFDGSFFRSPKDFSVYFTDDTFSLHWHADIIIPAGTLVNIQIEEPGGDFFNDPKHGVMIKNLVRSQIFTMNIGTPAPINPSFIMQEVKVTEQKNMLPAPAICDVPRNITLTSNDDCSGVTFAIYGVDLYDRPMCEHITGPQAKRFAIGNKAFAQVTQIIPSGTCDAAISAGVGDKLGLPSYLPGSGFLFRQLVRGKNVDGGIIIPGLQERPGPMTGDVRGTYTLPPDIQLDGKTSIQLLVSLFNPSHTGVRDFVG